MSKAEHAAIARRGCTYTGVLETEELQRLGDREMRHLESTIPVEPTLHSEAALAAEAEVCADMGMKQAQFGPVIWLEKFLDDDDIIEIRGWAGDESAVDLGFVRNKVVPGHGA